MKLLKCSCSSATCAQTAQLISQHVRHARTSRERCATALASAGGSAAVAVPVSVAAGPQMSSTDELQIKMQNNSILTPTSSSSATPGTRFLVRATSFARQALQAQQKRMESPDVVAQNADVAADDAGSGGTVIDLDVMTREALCSLLAPFSSGASSAGAAPGSIAACRDAWHAAGQLPEREAAMAIQASHAVWPEGAT